MSYRQYSQLVQHLVAVSNTMVVGPDLECLAQNDWHKTSVQEVYTYTHTHTDSYTKHTLIIKLLHF